MISYFTYESRGFLKSFSLLITVKTISLRRQLKIWSFLVVQCFGEDGKEMYQELLCMCTAIVLLIKPFV